MASLNSKITSAGTVTLNSTGGLPAGSITVPYSAVTGSYTGVTTGAGQTYTTISNGGSAWSNSQHSLTVTGNAEIEGTLKVGGRDISESLKNIEKRLAILVPDPEKLEKFEALKKAYEHYKLLEALCHEEKNSD